MKQKILKKIRDNHNLKPDELNMVKFFGAWYFTGKAGSFLPRTPIKVNSLKDKDVVSWNLLFSELVERSSHINNHYTTLRQLIDKTCWENNTPFIIE